MNAALRSADHARRLQELFGPLSEQDRVLLMNIVTALAERLRKDGGKNMMVRDRRQAKKGPGSFFPGSPC